MSEPDQAKPSGHTTLTEYDRADARVFFFQAIERDGKKVIENLIDSSAQDWASRWFVGREWAVRQGERTKSIWADSPKAQERLQFQMFPKGLMAGKACRAVQFSGTPDRTRRAALLGSSLEVGRRASDPATLSGNPENPWHPGQDSNL